MAYNVGESILRKPSIPNLKDLVVTDYDKASLQHTRLPVPAQLTVKPSSLPKAGLGVFATTLISKDVRMGPYEGKKVSVEEAGKFYNTAYAWEVREKKKKPYFIDAKDCVYSNWMRYVNCARNFKEQNTAAFQFKGKIYYRTITAISPGMELLVMYDNSYAVELFDEEVFEGSIPLVGNTNNGHETLAHLKQSWQGTLKNGLQLPQVLNKEEQSRSNACQSDSVDMRVTDQDAFGNHSVHAGGVISKHSTSKNLGKDLGDRSGTRSVIVQDIREQTSCTTSHEHSVQEHSVGMVTESATALLKLDGAIHQERMRSTGMAEQKVKSSHDLHSKLSARSNDSNIQTRNSCGDHSNNISGPPVETSNQGTLAAFTDADFRKLRLKCYFCQDLFLSELQLLEHVTCKSTAGGAEVDAMPQRRSTSRGTYSCPLCGKSFSRRYNMTSHCKTHYREKSIECKICHKFFHQKRYLRWHMPTHKERPLKCEYCGKGFSSPAMLVRHARTHSNNKFSKHFYCEHCFKYFKNDYSLLTHMKTHMGFDDMHICSHCCKIYTSQSMLDNHIKMVHLQGKKHHIRVVHLEGKKHYKCGQCDKVFKTASLCTAHSRVHTRERIFQCSCCDKSYIHPSNFYKHMKSHNRNQPKQHGLEGSDGGGTSNDSEEARSVSVCNDKLITPLGERADADGSEDVFARGDDLFGCCISQRRDRAQKCLQDLNSRRSSRKQVSVSVSSEPESCPCEAGSAGTHMLVSGIKKSSAELDEDKIVGIGTETLDQATYPNVTNNRLRRPISSGAESFSECDHMESMLKCGKCHENFQNKSGFLRHNCDSLLLKKMQNGGKLSAVKNVQNTSNPARSWSKECHFICGICGEQCVSLETLKDHILKHQKQYKCPICLRAFARRLDMVCHWKAHTRRNRHKCKLCHKSFRCKRYLDWHVPSHSSFKVVGKLGMATLKPHLIQRKNKKEEAPKDNTFGKGCLTPSSSYKEDSVFGHDYHGKEFHHGEVPNGSREPQEEEVSVVKRLGPWSNTGEAEQLYQCGHCDGWFRTIESLAVHCKTTHQEVFKCDLCDRTFGTLYALNGHCNAHKTEKLLKGIPCDGSSVEGSSLVAHSKSNKKDGSFKCDRCEIMFGTRSAFNNHCWAHQHGTLRTVSGGEEHGASAAPLECETDMMGEATEDKVMEEVDKETSDETIRAGCAEMGLKTSKAECSYSEGALKCRDCQKEFCSKADMQAHNCTSWLERSQNNDGNPRAVKETKPSRNILVCLLCGERYPTREALEDHRVTHKTCPVCHKVFTRKYSMITHLNAHAQQEKPFKCEKCHKSFLYKRYLALHVRTHSGMKFTCEVCGKKYKNTRTLRSHLAKHKEDPHNNDDNHRKVTGHKESPHKNDNVDTEEISTVTEVEESRMFKCDHCEIYFLTAKAMKAHQETHSEMQPFRCEHCDERFSSADTLNTHSRAYHAFKCDLCCKAFHTLRALNGHCSAHKTDKSFNCIHCDRKYICGAALIAHSQTHKEERPFKCDSCDDRFPTVETLREHCKMHDDNQLKCSQCDARFSTADALNTHCKEHEEWLNMAVNRTSVQLNL